MLKELREHYSDFIMSGCNEKNVKCSIIHDSVLQDHCILNPEKYNQVILHNPTGKKVVDCFIFINVKFHLLVMVELKSGRFNEDVRDKYVDSFEILENIQLEKYLVSVVPLLVHRHIRSQLLKKYARMLKKEKIVYNGRKYLIYLKSSPFKINRNFIESLI